MLLKEFPLVKKDNCTIISVLEIYLNIHAQALGRLVKGQYSMNSVHEVDGIATQLYQFQEFTGIVSVSTVDVQLISYCLPKVDWGWVLDQYLTGHSDAMSIALVLDVPPWLV